MKKLTIAMLIVSVAALVFAGAAFAQVDAPLNPGNGNGRGPSNTTNTGNQNNADSILHDYMVDYYAIIFGMDADVLDARMLAGESLTTIASALGYTADEIAALMDAAREYALNTALANGIITQDQYDLMIVSGNVMTANSYMGSTQSNGSGSQSNGQGGRGRTSSGMSAGSNGTGLNIQDGSCLP